MMKNGHREFGPSNGLGSKVIEAVDQVPDKSEVVNFNCRGCKSFSRQKKWTISLKDIFFGMTNFWICSSKTKKRAILEEYAGFFLSAKLCNVFWGFCLEFHLVFVQMTPGNIVPLVLAWMTHSLKAYSVAVHTSHSVPFGWVKVNMASVQVAASTLAESPDHKGNDPVSSSANLKYPWTFRELDVYILIRKIRKS